MADRSTAEKWLNELTHLPTASGLEDAVVDWVTKWVARRHDLRLTRDSGGNVLISQKGKKTHSPVLAVAHMDHPAFVITAVHGQEASFEFRGGVSTPYFEDALVEVVSRPGGAHGRVSSYDARSQTGVIRLVGSGVIEAGDIAMWKFKSHKAKKGRHVAPACDDLAGAAAALAALDLARAIPDLRHFGVLLTRAEEVGLIGAIHAAKHQTFPVDARVLSIETSRELPYAPIGAGPIIRTGDRLTVFDNELTNRISRAAEASGIKHQRKLMDGGGCEATAFAAYGYKAAGLCVPLGNWHNRGNLDEVEAGEGDAVPMLEEISLDDFHGLVGLLLIAAKGVDIEDPLKDSLDKLYDSGRDLLH
jgi:endoglucanase